MSTEEECTPLKEETKMEETRTEASTAEPTSAKPSPNNDAPPNLTRRLSGSVVGAVRRSSYFLNRRMSFFRSKGDRGADVSTLRGTSGADFEGNALVTRMGDYVDFCGCMFGSVESRSKNFRYVLVKGHSCFVFSSVDAPAPKYAIVVTDMRAEAKSPARGNTDVILKTFLGDYEYKFTFDTSEDDSIVEKFVNAVNHASAVGHEEVIKKKLGHEHLLVKRNSSSFANEIAEEKKKNQPEAPIGLTDTMAAYPDVFSPIG